MQDEAISQEMSHESNYISIDATVGWTARNRHDGITKNQENEEIKQTISPSRLCEPELLLSQCNQWKSI